MENIQKDSGIMTVSFSTDKTNKYIDCGRIHIDAKGMYGSKSANFKGEDHIVNYQLYNQETGYVVDVQRKIDLSGKANIIVQKLSQNQTKVSIKTRYIIHITNSFTGPSLMPSKQDDTFYFTNNEIGSCNTITGLLQCRSKGVFEKEILDSIGLN